MYKIKNSEQNNQTASDYETKALLHLLAVDKVNDEISILFVDCFNDLTGADESCDTLWDIQSKGVKSLRPLTVGEALVTLFLNYSSDLKISKSWLFIPKLRSGYLNDETFAQFDISNFKKDQQGKVKNGLVREYLRREGLEQITSAINKEIDQFLLDVLFVVAMPEKERYVREIVEFKDKDIYSSDLYKEVFKEIRDKQTALKNINVEGVEYEHPSDILRYKKHFEKKEIATLMISRLVGVELFGNRSVPISYSYELDGLQEEDRRDLVQHNNTALAKTLFNKNNKVRFWVLLEQIILLLKKHPRSTSRELYSQLSRAMLGSVNTLDESSVIYFISLIKDGISNEN